MRSPARDRGGVSREERSSWFTYEGIAARRPDGERFGDGLRFVVIAGPQQNNVSATGVCHRDAFGQCMKTRATAAIAGGVAAACRHEPRATGAHARAIAVGRIGPAVRLVRSSECGGVLSS